MRNHYTLANLKRAIRNPRLILREIVRTASLPVHLLYGRYYDATHDDGVDVMDEDWDNLFILDACRYDAFEAQNTIDGTLEPRQSRGRKSWEFMKSNFAGRELHDTVYVTANPFVSKLDDDVFYAVDRLADVWDDEVGTIHPDDVADRALEAREEYPDKRLIVHFMQPHRPYLGPTAETLRDRVDLVGFDNEGEGLQIWGAVKQTEVSVSEVRTAYAETLEIVLAEVARLLDALDGRTVVTSDHGEMLGERVLPVTSRIWGHSEGFSTPQLRTVPWLTVAGETRRETTVEETAGKETTESERLDEDVVAERLQALGYRDE